MEVAGSEKSPYTFQMINKLWNNNVIRIELSLHDLNYLLKKVRGYRFKPFSHIPILNRHVLVTPFIKTKHILGYGHYFLLVYN